MTPAKIKERLAELNPEALFADGFDEALVGIVRQFNRYLALYDYEKCVDVLDRDHITGSTSKPSLVPHDHREMAEEYFEFNVVGSWMGENTPCFEVPLEE